MQSLPMQQQYDQANRDLLPQLEFTRARRRATLRRLVAALTRRPNRLIPYHEARRGLPPGAESYRGVRSVPVARIVGSVDRAADFDGAFLPRGHHSARRWQRVLLAHDDGLRLPPIEVYAIGDAYFVKDGHHRVSVARFKGLAYLDAAVTEVVAPAPASSPAPLPPAPALFPSAVPVRLLDATAPTPSPQPLVEAA